MERNANAFFKSLWSIKIKRRAGDCVLQRTPLVAHLRAGGTIFEVLLDSETSDEIHFAVEVSVNDA